VNVAIDIRRMTVSIGFYIRNVVRTLAVWIGR
jgi:hypothetical protein